MTNIDLAVILCIADRARILDVDGPVYQEMTKRVSEFEHLDLCWLAAQNISFVSAIARKVIADRYPNSLHA